MDETNMMTSDTMEAQLDSAWGEDGCNSWESAQPEANQPMEQQEGTPAPEGDGERPAADRQQESLENQQAPVMIPYTYLGENKQMSAAEAPQFIQKGMHYDTVRAERDQLRRYRDENQAAVDLVQKYAQRMNMNVPQYLDWCRKQELMQGGMDEQTAARELQFEKREADLSARQAKIDAFDAVQVQKHNEQKSRQAAIKKDVKLFASVYPGVQAESLSQEVWAQVAKGVPLVGAYAMHEAQQLKAQLAAERQNRANQQRTPGALGGSMAAELDELDRCWNDND